MDSLQVGFQVAALEVWGCGGQEALRAQREQRQRADGVREQARKARSAQATSCAAGGQGEAVRERLRQGDVGHYCSGESIGPSQRFLGNTFAATAGSREVSDPKAGEETDCDPIRFAVDRRR